MYTGKGGRSIEFSRKMVFGLKCIWEAKSSDKVIDMMSINGIYFSTPTVLHLCWSHADNYGFLRLQMGASPVHCPLAWHFLHCTPTSTNPLLQLYSALEPGAVPLTLTEPYLGLLREGQPTPGRGGGEEEGKISCYISSDLVYGWVTNMHRNEGVVCY